MGGSMHGGMAGDVDSGMSGGMDGNIGGGLDLGMTGGIGTGMDGNVGGSMDLGITGGIGTGMDGNVGGASDLGMTGGIGTGMDGNIGGASDQSMTGAVDAGMSGTADAGMSGAVDADMAGAVEGNAAGTVDLGMSGTTDVDISGAVNTDMSGGIVADVGGAVDLGMTGTVDTGMSGTVNTDMSGGINAGLAGGVDAGMSVSVDGDIQLPGGAGLPDSGLNDGQGIATGGQPGSFSTADFTLDDVISMIEGMNNGFYFNYQGQIAADGEPTLTLDQLNAMLAELSAPDVGPPTDTGAQVDTGAAVDAGASVDAGAAIDTGGSEDTGASVDTGAAVETGAAVDTGAQAGGQSGQTGGAGGESANMVDINPVATGDASSNTPMDVIDSGLPFGGRSDPPSPPAGGGSFSPSGEFIGEIGPEWLKARIDSAPCREWNCNLPICYVPHANDCKSYIVCQRTAIGTYVAWKMRCAFGSYWGTGKLWTCERVEDLASMGYTCPNDPCMDGALTTYADEDDKNCRTYWKCEGKISRPACCLAGQRFDRATLTCVDDPEETCRAPCPLKIEGCSLPGAMTQPFYDGNCRTYWNCTQGHPHPVCCPGGQSYDSSMDVCVTDPTCADECPPEYSGDVCGKVTGNAAAVQSYGLHDGNCRTFMKCNKKGKGYSDAFCCRQNHYYNAQTGHCERVEDPMDPCHAAVCPTGYKEECRFTAIEGAPKKYFDSDAGLDRDCAPGTSFNEEICTCDGNAVAETCKKEVWAKFDQLQDRWSVKNYGDGWISVVGHMQKNQSKQGITYGTFDGSSGMEVWRYDHTALPAVTLKLTFQPVASGNEKQILVSNCRSVDGDLPSFEISINPATSSIDFTGVTKFDTAVLGVQYNKQAWNTYTLLFDGHNVLAQIEDPAALGQADSASTSLRGEIIAGLGALKFGPCLDRNSAPMSNGFTGFVSEVIFSKCIDKDNKAVIRAAIKNGNGAVTPN